MANFAAKNASRGLVRLSRSHMGLMTLIVLWCAIGAMADVLGGSLLKSDEQLHLLDSYSVISESTYQQHPDLYDAQKSAVEGSFYAAIVDTLQAKLLFSGYEGFYAPYENVYPSGVFYDVSFGNITEVSRLSVPVGSGQTNALIPINAAERYIAISRYTPVGFVSPYVTHSYIIYLHNYSALGVVDQSPAAAYDMSGLAPNFYNKSVAYTGLSGISSDGKFVIGTYAVGLPVLGAVTGQKHVILRVASDHSGLTPVVTIDTVPTGFARLFSFPQKTVLFPTTADPTKYHFVSADNSWNLTAPLGFTAGVSSYIFDSVANTLTLVDSEPVAQYIQGFDVDRKNGIVYTITNEVSSNGVSTLQFARTPYANAAVDKDSELRAWKLDISGNLTYLGGLELASDGIQVHPSPNGKYLAITYASIIGNDVQYTNFTGLGNISRTYSPTTLNLYKVKLDKDGVLSLDLRDTSSASPLTFGLAFDAKSALLGVAGQSTYRVLPNGYRAGQKDTQLYEVVDHS